MRMSLPWKWEQLDKSTHRAKIPGGWLVFCENGSGSSIALTEIKDQNHEWKIEEEKPDPIVQQSNLAKDFEVPV